MILAGSGEKLRARVKEIGHMVGIGLNRRRSEDFFYRFVVILERGPQVMPETFHPPDQVSGT